MEKESRAAQIGKVLFYVALIIEIGIVIIDKSAYINPIEGRLFQLTFLLCVAKIVMTKYSLKEWLLMAAFILLGFIVDQATGRNEIIRFVAFIAASKNINVKTVMKVTFFGTLAGVLCLVALSFMGVLGSVYIEAEFRDNDIIERRYCFGLGHPNAFHCMAWALTTLGIYLYRNRMKIYHYLILLVMHIGLFMFTDSKAGLAAAVITICMAILFHCCPKLCTKNWVYIMGLVGFAICILFSVYAGKFALAPHTYAMDPFLSWIDVNILTGRMRWSCYLGGLGNWALFTSTAAPDPFDMGYIRMFAWYGIIPTVTFIAVKGLQLMHTFRKKDISAFILLVSFYIYTVFEAHTVSAYIARDYALLLMFGAASEIFFIKGGNEGYFWQLKTIFTKQEKI